MKTKNIVITLILAFVTLFANGQDKRNWEYISLKNKKPLPSIVYDNLRNMNKGYCFTWLGRYDEMVITIYDLKGNVYKTFEKGIYYETGSNKEYYILGRKNADKKEELAIINYKGDVLIPFQLCYSPKIIDNKYFKYQKYNKEKNEYIWFYTDTTGKIINTINPNDFQSKNFYNSAELGDGFILMDEKTRKSGVVDMDLNIVVPFEYDELHFIGDGVFKATKQIRKGYSSDNDLYAYVSKDGKLKTDFIYNEIGDFNEGISFAVENKGWKLSFFNNKLEIAIPNDNLYTRNQDLGAPGAYFSGGLAKVVVNKEPFDNAYINKKGVIVLSLPREKYPILQSFYDNGLAILDNKSANRTEVIDKEGKVIMKLKLEKGTYYEFIDDECIMKVSGNEVYVPELTYAEKMEQQRNALNDQYVADMLAEKYQFSDLDSEFCKLGLGKGSKCNSCNGNGKFTHEISYRTKTVNERNADYRNGQSLMINTSTTTTTPITYNQSCKICAGTGHCSTNPSGKYTTIINSNYAGICID